MENWTSKTEQLPEDNKAVLVWLGNEKPRPHMMLAHYGHFEFVDEYGDYPDADEDDGMVRRFGFHYERESEGEHDYLIFDINEQVTHWVYAPNPPKADDKE